MSVPGTGAPDFRVAIPARYASTRLPGKPLLDIAGKPMVVRVLDRALAASDRILLLAPGQVDELRDRGLLQLQRRAFRAASEDLNNYLSLAPMADDRHLIAARASEARTRVRQMN